MEQNLTSVEFSSVTVTFLGLYLKYTQNAIRGGEASFKLSMEIIKMAYDNSLCLMIILCV